MITTTAVLQHHKLRPKWEHVTSSSTQPPFTNASASCPQITPPADSAWHPHCHSSQAHAEPVSPGGSEKCQGTNKDTPRRSWDTTESTSIILGGRFHKVASRLASAKEACFPQQPRQEGSEDSMMGWPSGNIQEPRCQPWPGRGGCVQRGGDDGPSSPPLGRRPPQASPAAPRAPSSGKSYQDAFLRPPGLRELPICGSHGSLPWKVPGPREQWGPCRELLSNSPNL